MEQNDIKCRQCDTVQRAGSHGQCAECGSRYVEAYPRRCTACATHYGDNGLCDEGKPAASPHRCIVCRKVYVPEGPGQTACSVACARFYVVRGGKVGT